ncbi:MAG: hypothetical protein WBG86_11380 [Polyangiales bacterium]
MMEVDMGAKREHAIALYMEGIRDGRAREAVTQYTGDRYTQHRTGVADGVEGFVAFFEDFLERTPVRDIQVVRSLEDGQYVFLQAFQSLDDGATQWVTTDFFDTDSSDKLVEHWDVIAAYSTDTPSGHTSVDGSRALEDHEDTESNKKIVRDMVEGVLVAGGTATELEAFVDVDVTQHDTALPDGFGPYAAHVAGEHRSLAYDEIVLLVGEGNFVATLSKARLDAVPTAQVDLYRLSDRKIVERWSNAEPVPPPEEWANSGKF